MIPIYVIGFALVATVAFAVFFKDEVKAGMKMLGIEFSIEARNRDRDKKR